MSSSDDRQALDELRQRYARLEAQADALRRETTETVRSLLQALEDQRLALEEAARAEATMAAIRASNSGRVAALWAALRAQARRVRLARRTRIAQQAQPKRRRRPSPALSGVPLGVNVAGYINAESGMGEATRCTIRALQLAGVPVALNNVRAPQRMLDPTFSEFTERNPHPFNVVHLNADNMEWFAGQRGRDYFQDKYTIGYWFWELEQFRPDWLPNFEYVDEVWVASEHSRRSIGRDAPVPVLHVPLGLPEPVMGPFGRAHFGLPDRPFIFLYTFDVSSQMERKNPMGAIRAFRLAGLGHDEAMLLLKFTNAHTNRDAVRQLADASHGLNVQMLEGAIDRAELNSLMSVTDCCVSLHRAEGLGLTVAEHMAHGKPAIATAYSGTLDFMTPEVSCLVQAQMVHIDHNYGPYLRGYLWADPDLDEAARHMRDLARAPERAHEIGLRGAEHVKRVLSIERSSLLMKHRLEQVREGTLAVSGVAPPIDSLRPTYA